MTKKSNNLEFEINYFLYGIITILYQFGKNSIILYIAFITNMMKQHLLNLYQLKDMEALLNKYPEYPPNVLSIQTFLMEIIDNFDISINSFEISISSFLFTKKLSTQ